MAAEFDLPESHLPHTDKYFMRARQVLEGEGLDPEVLMQVFIRQGPGTAHGVDEAVAILRRYAGPGCRAWALPEGSAYGPAETLMLIQGPVRSFIELETMYLGVLAAATSRRNDGTEVDLGRVRAHASLVRELLPDKQLIYFGARHWHWSLDEDICREVAAAGFDACATDAGAWAAGQKAGVGTIPHALVLSLARFHGEGNATRESTLAFDRHMEPAIARIALVDTFNREVDDTLDTARALGDRLWGVRLDTAGEMVGQGGVPFDGRAHWTGPGVTVELARSVRAALDRAGREDVRIVLSSGFGDPDKIRAFVEGEKRYGRLFDSVGLGSVYQARYATADIVRVDGLDMAKKGRGYRANPRLVRVL